MRKIPTAQPAEAIRRRGSAAIMALAATVALAALTLPPPAYAAQKPPEKSTKPTQQTVARPAGEPIMAIVSIKSQHVTFYDADGWILRSPVSTGTTGRETPAGVFAVIEKDKDHHSSMYDDAWMPNMQRITWNGIALHGGPLPGYAASHGCIRMPYDFAEKLFDKTRLGMRVIISPIDAEPVEFSHPSLFVPQQQAIAAAPAKADELARVEAEAAKTIEPAKKAAAAAKKAAADAPAAVRKAEQAKARADAEFITADRALAAHDKAIAAAKTDEARQKAEEAKVKAEDVRQKASAKVEQMRAQVDAAKADAKARVDAAKATQDAVKAAEAKKAQTAKAALEAKLALEPVQVFISRSAQKIYVRRGTHKRTPDGGEYFDTSFEVPVTIRDPDKALGTHIITAVARDQAGLRWTAVTIDEGDTAKDALDRITIPPEVLAAIGPTAVPRSSIVISDEGLSRETNYRTEYVIVLNNQPQGGFITRKPSPRPVQVARDDGYGGGGFFGGGGWWGNQNNDRYDNRRQPGGYYDNRQGGGYYYDNRQGGGYYYDNRQNTQNWNYRR